MHYISEKMWKTENANRFCEAKVAFRNGERWISLKNPSLAGEYSTVFSVLTSEFNGLLQV